MAKKDKGVVKRALVIPDVHFPFEDKAAINVVLKAINIVKPDIFINLGDVGEWGSVSHWQWRKKKRPPLEYQLPAIEQDVIDVNKGMDRFDEALDKVNCEEKYFIQGNHDEWCDRFVEENPYLKQYGFDRAIKLKERGYNFYPCGKYLKLGKLWFYHGHHFAGIHHTRNHLLRTGANMIYGHWHDMQQCSVTHLDGAKSAWSIGCLKDMSEDKNLWLGGRRHNWSHAFAIVDFYERGFFTTHVIQIINGKTSLWGELIKGE
ncbi:MAG: metallophosphoesterase [Candidatus Brocadiales bacterium]|nr:metallophosphoesterase [Candidatus Brocadiales bacterium]